ncbi:MAG: hypothetical protein U0L62_07620 [Paludibacteraceae bacterium]|nr:hypothetical protein [Paludibacteraceae bacterium]
MREPILTKCVIRSSQDGYKINEVLIDDYQLKEGEFLAVVKTYPADGYNNQTCVVDFISEEDYIVCNQWKIPKSINGNIHYRGSYASTNFQMSCISPDGLKVDFSFPYSEAVGGGIGFLYYFLSKLWFTAYKTAAETDQMLISITSCTTPTNDFLAKEVKSVAHLKQLIRSYKKDDTTNIDILWALQKEYDSRLKKLLEIALK